MQPKDYLGMNLRNLKYIDTDNKKAIDFTNSKLKTKFFLSARQIRVPRLHRIIKSHKDLQRLDFASLPGNTVLKPNKGSQGRGIIPFKKRQGTIFTTVSNRVYDDQFISKHILDILDGKYSMGFLPDLAFFEEKIESHKDLKDLAPIGLPDIRIIIYKGFPVLSMLRLPTEESKGKANLNSGAIAMGLDLISGKVISSYQNGKLIKSKYINSFQVPYYKESLEMGVKIADITKLNFFGCDIAVSKNGPVLIELNSRPGLKIQFVNNIGLKKRLEKIDDLKYKGQKQAISLAHHLFSSSSLEKNTQNPKTININNKATILYKNKKIQAQILIRTDKNSTYLSKDIQAELNIKKDSKIKVKTNQFSEIIKLKTLDDIPPQSIVLGKKILSEYNVSFNNPSKKIQLPKAIANKQNIFYKPQINYGQVDYQIYQICQSLKLVEKLKPINLKQELKKFAKDPSYNPQFRYDSFDEFVYNKQNALLNIKCDDSALGQIYEEKKTELFNLLNIIQNIGSPEILHYFSKYIPAPSYHEYKYAKKLRALRTPIKSKNLNTKEIKKIIQKTLDEYKLNDWKIQEKKTMLGKFSVNKQDKIFIKQGTSVSEFRLKQIIAHEIMTHVFTTENGKKQPYLLFQDGMANYIQTQEGLAIYNEYALVGQQDRYFSAGNMISSYISLEKSFSSAVAELIKIGFTKTSAIKHVLKTKRGLSDTSKPGGITKQCIYTRGALKVEKFIKNGGDIKDLYVGKIDIDKLEVLKKLKCLNKAKHMPKQYLS